MLAPFNTTITEGKNTDLTIKLAKFFHRKLILDKDQVIKFKPKVKEIDRQYELNNNGIMDNGVFNDNKLFGTGQ